MKWLAALMVAVCAVACSKTVKNRFAPYHATAQKLLNNEAVPVSDFLDMHTVCIRLEVTTDPRLCNMKHFKVIFVPQ